MSVSKTSGSYRLRWSAIAVTALLTAAFLCFLLAGFIWLTSSSLPAAPQTPDSPSNPAPTDTLDWRLTLVNPTTPMEAGYEPPQLTQLQNGQAVDSRCYADLQQMMDDCRAAGCEPLICSSYRTQEKQESLFEQKVDSLLAEGYSQTQAEEIAGENVAAPGTSEHQLGLAVDIVDVNQQVLEEEQEDTPTQQWLLANSWKYGFILRYPENKSSITGITYEPWHYRYVGRQAAQEIYSQGICLEEYLESIK